MTHIEFFPTKCRGEEGQQIKRVIHHLDNDRLDAALVAFERSHWKAKVHLFGYLHDLRNENKEATP